MSFDLSTLLAHLDEIKTASTDATSDELAAACGVSYRTAMYVYSIITDACAKFPVTRGVWRIDRDVRASRNVSHDFIVERDFLKTCDGLNAYSKGWNEFIKRVNSTFDAVSESTTRDAKFVAYPIIVWTTSTKTNDKYIIRIQMPWDLAT